MSRSADRQIGDVEGGEVEAIAEVIRNRARTHDGRAHWRPEGYLRRLLVANGAAPTIAQACTDAAIRVGDAIRQRAKA